MIAIWERGFFRFLELFSQHNFMVNAYTAFGLCRKEDNLDNLDTFLGRRGDSQLWVLKSRIKFHVKEGE